MLLYLYVLDYSGDFPYELQLDPGISDALDDRRSKASLKLHVAMYTAGDRYLIPSLKDLAQSRFSTSIRTLWPIPGFAEISAEVFSTTPSCDRGLRDPVVELCVAHAPDIVEGLSRSCVAGTLATSNTGTSDQNIQETSTLRNSDASDQDEEHNDWVETLTKDGLLTTEILTKVVQRNDKEMTQQREVYEDMIGELGKARCEAKTQKELYETLYEEFADYKAYVDQMMRYGAKSTTPCSCDGGYRIHFTSGTANVRPWLRLICVKCRARSGRVGGPW